MSSSYGQLWLHRLMGLKWND